MDAASQLRDRAASVPGEAWNGFGSWSRLFAGARILCVAGAGARVASGLLGAFAAGLGLGDLFGNLRVQFVELGVAQSYKMQVAAFEGAKFGAEVRGAQFAVGELGLDRDLLFRA